MTLEERIQNQELLSRIYAQFGTLQVVMDKLNKDDPRYPLLYDAYLHLKEETMDLAIYLGDGDGE